MSPDLPLPRGSLGVRLFDRLMQAPHELPRRLGCGTGPLDDDEVLALYVCYELHYRGFASVDENWEWEPSLLRLRARLEHRMVEQLYKEIGPPKPCRDVVAALREVLDSGSGPSLSSYMRDRGTLRQFREFAIHRSVYQLKEADPHTWAIPRLHGEAKAALVTIQADEYGSGVERDMHSTLFAQTLRGLSLGASYGAYLHVVPASTLATVNLISLFGLHRRWRGALVGHLSIFEMASVGPNRAYGDALRRLGFDSSVTRFYDVHVEADAIHQDIAAHQLAAGLVRSEPELAGDIVFGARSIMATEGRFARHLLDSWGQDASSLDETARAQRHARTSHDHAA